VTSHDCDGNLAPQLGIFCVRLCVYVTVDRRTTTWATSAACSGTLDESSEQLFKTELRWRYAFFDASKSKNKDSKCVYKHRRDELH